jgi:hypothetical protein
MLEKVLIYDIFNKEYFGGSNDEGKPYFTVFQTEVRYFKNILEAQERMLNENIDYPQYLNNRIFTFITVYYLEYNY